MKTVIEGVLSADLPWSLVAVGAVVAVVIQLLGIPALPFAVGMYLPLSSTSPIFVGGVVRHFLEKGAGGDQTVAASRKEQGVLLSSGLIAGEGIMGVAIALFAFASGSRGIGIGVDLGQGASIIAFGLLISFLVLSSVRQGQQ